MADEVELPRHVKAGLYRIASEALANALRHGDAQVVELRLRRTAAAVALTVTDDGRGLAATPVAGIGLASMRERARELGGALTVDSRPGRGTCVRASVPLRAMLAA